MESVSKQESIYGPHEQERMNNAQEQLWPYEQSNGGNYKYTK